MSAPETLPPPSCIGIIGDVHGEPEILEAALHNLSDVDCILCTGDIIDGPGCADACVRLLQKYQVVTVAGNHERWLFTGKLRDIPHADQRHLLASETLSFLASLPQCVEIQTSDGRLLLSHGAGRKDTAQVWPGSDKLGPQRSSALDSLVSSNRYKYFVHGHIHYRLILEFQRMTLINPGALKRNLQPGFMPGFMVLYTDERMLKCCHMNDSGMIVEEAIIPIAEKTRAQRVWVDTQEFDGDWEVFRIANYMAPVRG